MRLRLLPFFLVSLLCAQQLLADTITLKTGEVVTGTIKSETDAQVTIEVSVSSSITDERVINKADIAKEEKVQPDDIAYQQLAQQEPNPEFSYSSQQYDLFLSQLNAFETSYPNSAHIPDVKKLADTFRDEKMHVVNGQYKYLGRWISQQEAQTRAGQIQGMQLYAQMEQQAGSGDFIGAMQTFANLERTSASTRSYPVAVTLAQQVVARIKQVLAQSAAQLTAQQAQLKQTIAFTAEPEKSNLIQQARAEQDRAAAVVAESIRSGAKWVPLIPNSTVSIQTLQTVANNEGSRLNSIQTANMNLSIGKVDAARAAMDSGKLKDADDLLTQAASLWPENEDARYALTQLKALVLKMATPTPTPKPKPSPKPTPRPTPQMVTIITAPTPEPEAKPFYMTIPGAMGIAAVVLIAGGIFTVMGQRKKRLEEVEE
jgi:hypothetical protein